MRICLVSHSFYPAFYYGGPISATNDLSKRLGNKGIEIYVSTTNANGSERLEVVPNKFINLHKNVKVKYYHEQIIYYLSIAFIFGLWNDIKKSDVVYIQYIFHYSVLLSLLYSWLLNKKIILCPRASLSPWGLSWKGKVSFFIKTLWLRIVIKPFLKNIKWQGCSYIENNDIRLVFPDADCSEISDGVDVKSFNNHKEISYSDLVLKYTGEDFLNISDIVFSMGRLHEIKGFDILINAFYLVLLEKPNAKLLIAGSNDGCKSSLAKQIKTLHLENSVFLIGLVNHSQKAELLANSTVFSLCSHTESFGIVVLESLACGTAVVVSDKTIWKDLEQKKCGIFTNNKKKKISEAILRAIATKYDSRDCINYVKDNYDWSIVTHKFINLINKN